MNNQFIAAFDNLRSNLGILARAVQEQSKQLKEYENRFRLLEAIKSPQSSDFDDKILKLKNDILSSVDDKLKNSKSNDIENLIDDKIKKSNDLIDDKIKKSIVSEDTINNLVTDILNKAINPIPFEESASVSVDNSTDDISIVEPTSVKPARKSRAKKAV
jgi:hypothetical protein